MKRLLTIAFLLISFSAFAQISFIDHTNKTITLEKVPEKVIVLNSSNLEIFYAVGGTPYAYAESSTMPKYIKDKLGDISSVGKVSNPDVEKITAINPDLVIGMNFPFHIALRDSLESAGIKTAMFSAGNMAETAEILSAFGKITGNKERADNVWKEMMAKLEKLNDKILQTERKKVMVVYGSPESFSMALPESVIGQIVYMAGGDNIAAGAKKTKSMGISRGFIPVSLEYAIMEDPEYIFVITHRDIVSPAADKSLLKHPAWKSLRAVKEGRTVMLPFATYGINPTVRLAEAVTELHKIIYPETTR